ncbi:MAG TPA: hypothetical protein VGM62_11275 [Chthoniobacterales bacterium]|jgi:hypothetical protein
MLEHPCELFFGVSRVETRFVDDLGNIRTGAGSGFWIHLSSGRNGFVTNRHNVDPTIKFGPDTKLRLDSTSLLLRKRTAKGGQFEYHPETKFFRLTDKSQIAALHNADCAIIIPDFEQPINGFEPLVPFEQSDLADRAYFQEKLLPAHECYFIGFAGRPGDALAGTKGIFWWDTKWNLPIARPAFIASIPFMPFRNEGISLEDAMLVSGMSFEGASGSPLISNQIGLKMSPPLHCESYSPQKIIGIIAGHWWADRDSIDIFKHSGLSHFTPSTAILHLIQTNGI